jgi:hypothetical protein
LKFFQNPPEPPLKIILRELPPNPPIVNKHGKIDKRIIANGNWYKYGISIKIGFGTFSSFEKLNKEPKKSRQNSFFRPY